jgi:hypothetical protein
MPLTTVPPAASSTNLPPSKQQSIRARLVENGSALSYNDGNDPSFNKLAGDGNTNRNYSLHYDPSTPDTSNGYSVTGNNFSTINSYYQDYLDGKNTPLPEPTDLDINDPVTADPKYKPKYNSLPGKGYVNQF